MNDEKSESHPPDSSFLVPRSSFEGESQLGQAHERIAVLDAALSTSNPDAAPTEDSPF